MSTQTKVVIVGAGVAGIAAACRLIEEGFKNIIILEAKNRIGGRIHTVDFADNVVDLGAQWVHGESQNIGYNLASPHGLLESSHNLNDFEKHSFVNSKGELIPAEQASKVWKLYYEISDKASEELRNRNGSYGEYFVEEYYKHYKTDPFTDESRAEEILEWIHRFDNSIQCSDNWYDVSAKGITEYKSCDGDLLLNWKNRGYKTIFDLLMRKFPNSQKALPLMDKIEFGKEVSSIDYSSGSEVIVKTIEGQQFSAAHVIFTASLGFLKEQHSKIFIPPLPQKKQLSIKGLSIGVVAKIFLEFPHRWWPENSAGFGMLWSREDKLDFIATNGQNKSWLCDLFQFFTVDYQPRILCGWLVGQSARDMELLPEESVKNDVYELLEKFLGKTYNIPRPDHIVRTKWYSDRHFRGCYSYRSMAAEKLDVWAKDLAQPILDANIKPTLLFAGEATHDKYYSTVHGAIETGYREADRILNYYRQLKSHL
ncbi:spermine oxidase isoform X3 [Venturia canescens]|uniref:spermine oxidase isoform X3 n=1 Tax=Venturia canescens TaxID=32260 RepID=UPI001C9D101A|nr:spermine oxidase-like isoform X3 [Venturia canescens]XP_043269281.1 spermine oxidase-like isoform X3 [Venturia canescens]